ncbi:hypothetical protein WEI85_28525 [Actinomycetes bacterium KLBMP 9797]
MALSDGWYLAGPLIAFAVVGALTVVLRRAFGRDVPAADDFGLLAVAALTDRAEVAAEVRAALARVGIRSTAAPGVDGLIRVLVFPDDAARARRALSP